MNTATPARETEETGNPFIDAMNARARRAQAGPPSDELQSLFAMLGAPPRLTFGQRVWLATVATANVLFSGFLLGIGAYAGWNLVAWAVARFF